jgi:hypothetical protein
MVFRIMYMLLICIGIISNMYLAFSEQDDIAGQNILLWLILLELNTLTWRKES